MCNLLQAWCNPGVIMARLCNLVHNFAALLTLGEYTIYDSTYICDRIIFKDVVRIHY